MLRVRMITMRAEKLWWGRRGRWREGWQLALTLRHSLRTDWANLLPLSFSFNHCHCYFSPFHSQSQLLPLKSVLSFCKMHMSDASDVWNTCIYILCACNKKGLQLTFHCATLALITWFLDWSQFCKSISNTALCQCWISVIFVMKFLDFFHQILFDIPIWLVYL